MPNSIISRDSKQITRLENKNKAKVTGNANKTNVSGTKRVWVLLGMSIQKFLSILNFAATSSRNV